MLSSLGIRAYRNLHRKFFSAGFYNSIFIIHTGLGSDTLWAGFGFCAGMCDLHNVCCCCVGQYNRDTCLRCRFGIQGSGKPEGRSEAGSR